MQDNIYFFSLKLEITYLGKFMSERKCSKKTNSIQPNTNTAKIAPAANYLLPSPWGRSFLPDP
jgi:hypothetical protein